MAIQFGVVRPAGDDRALDCPRCGPNETPYLYLERRFEVAGPNVYLDYHCELCGQSSCLNLVHHKGQTLIFWSTD